MFFALLAAAGLLFLILSVPRIDEPGDGALATIEKAVEATGTAIKTIGERIDKADKSIFEADGRLKSIDEQVKKVISDLGTAQKSLNDHIESTRAALKSLPGVHSGGHDRPPAPWRTREGDRGFVWSDYQACKAFGLWLMTGCCPRPEQRDAAMKALDKLQGERWYGAAFKAVELAAKTAGSTNVFSNAGAMVPDAFIPDIIRNVEMMGHFAANAGRIPMSAPTVTMPKSLTELTVYYPDENVAITESDPSFGDITFNARLYATLTKWSNTLDEDSAVDFGAFISELIAYAHAKAVDSNGFIGDGTSTYARVIGIINAITAADRIHILGNATGATANNTGKDTFGEIAYSDLVSAQALLPTKARAGAKWYCHRYVAGILNGLVDTSGRPIFQHDYVNGKRVTRILGDPLVEIDVMPSITAVTTDFIVYGNLRLAMGYGERRSLRIDNSKEAGFAADQTWVRSTARRAIGALDPTMCVKLRTSTT